jgi:hypothetical protein
VDSALALLRLASSFALDTSAVPGRVLLPLSESGALLDSSLLPEEALDADDDDDDEDPSLS